MSRAERLAAVSATKGLGSLVPAVARHQSLPVSVEVRKLHFQREFIHWITLYYFRPRTVQRIVGTSLRLPEATKG